MIEMLDEVKSNLKAITFKILLWIEIARLKNIYYPMGLPVVSYPGYLAAPPFLAFSNSVPLSAPRPFSGTGTGFKEYASH